MVNYSLFKLDIAERSGQCKAAMRESHGYFSTSRCRDARGPYHTAAICGLRIESRVGASRLVFVEVSCAERPDSYISALPPALKFL
jgi:hypothetical protein